MLESQMFIVMYLLKHRYHFFLSLIRPGGRSLGRVDGSGVKVALGVHRRLLLQRPLQADVHKVGRQGPGDGAQARLGHFEELGVVLLQTGRREEEDEEGEGVTIWLLRGRKNGGRRHERQRVGESAER